MLERVSVSTVLFWSSALSLAANALLGWSRLSDDTAELLLSPELRWLFVTTLVAQLLANLLTMMAIQEGNAVVVSVIETAYPLWVLLFSVVVFHRAISLSTLIGALFVFAGIAIIYTGDSSVK